MMTKICRLLALRAALLGAVCCLCSCATPHSRSAATIDHVVIVWLKRPGNATDKARLVAVSEELSSHIPHIRRVAWGEALPSTRPAVDDSFDLAFVMEFSGRTSLEAYEIHPAHIRAVKDTLRPLARRVVIYDIARR